jgi:hypothetical protein
LKESKMRIFKAVLCAALSGGMLLCTAAQADISCAGTLSAVLLYSDGSVMIQGSWRNDLTMICNTRNNFGGIDTPTCLAWYGAAVKASQSHVTVGTYYSGDTYTCANLPTYHNSPPPVYLMTSAN